MAGKGQKPKPKSTFGRAAAGLILLILLLTCSVAQAAIPWRYDYAGDMDWMEKFFNNPQLSRLTLANGANLTTSTLKFDFVATVPAANQFLFNPVSAAVGTVEGTVYYDSDTDKLFVRNSNSWVDLTAGAGAAAGSDTQIQYNDGGSSFGGIAGFIWDDTNVELADDINFAWGTDADWLTQYDEGVDDQLLWITANTAATATTDPMFEILVGATPTPNQEVFGIGKGTQASNTALLTLDEDGDLVVTASVTTVDITATGNTILGDVVGDTLTITASIIADVYFDDGAGSAPQLIFKDGSDETAAFSKGLTSALVLTTQSDDGLTIAVGNLRVGNGTPTSAAMDGEDGYVEGEFEVDGVFTADATSFFNDVVQINESLDINLDAADENVNITTSATNYASDAAVVTVYASGAGQTDNTYLLRLRHAADGDGQDHFLVLEDNDGDNIFSIASAGVTTWSLDPGGTVQIDAGTIANTITTGVLNLDVESATNGSIAFSLDYELEDGATQAYGIKINVDDDATGGETFDAINIANATGTASTVRGIVFANTLDDNIVSALGVAGQYLTLDASSAINTTTAGLFDITAILSEPSASVINIDVETEANGAGEDVYGIIIQMDDDADNADNEIHGVHVQGDGTDGTGLQHALYVEGANIDAGLYLATGYLRVGTGASPDVALGDDDAFIEGDLEVDGTFRLDGAGGITLANGFTISSGTDNKITFADDEDVVFSFAVSNTWTLETTTGIDTIDFGVLDELEGLQTLVGGDGQSIDFAVNEKITIGDTEKITFNFTGSDTWAWETSTSVTILDVGDIDQIQDVEYIEYDDSTVSRVMVTSVTLNSAQIKALVGSPFEIVPDPGADKMVWPIEAVLILDFGSNVLVETSDNLVLGWNSAAVVAGETIESTTFIDSAADAITNWHMAKDEIITPASGATNVNFALKNDSGDFTGNAGNDTELTVTLYYRIITLGL